MWAGIWGKFCVDLYIRLAGFDNDTLLSVMFGNYDLIADRLEFDLREKNLLLYSPICLYNENRL